MMKTGGMFKVSTVRLKKKKKKTGRLGGPWIQPGQGTPGQLA